MSWKNLITQVFKTLSDTHQKSSECYYVFKEVWVSIYSFINGIILAAVNNFSLIYWHGFVAMKNAATSFTVWFLMLKLETYHLCALWNFYISFSLIAVCSVVWSYRWIITSTQTSWNFFDTHWITGECQMNFWHWSYCTRLFSMSTYSILKSVNPCDAKAQLQGMTDMSIANV